MHRVSASHVDILHDASLHRYDAPLWAVNGGKPTWFGIEIPFDLNTLLVIEFVAMAAAEARRGDEQEASKRVYPGGAFDPLGFAKGNVDELKLKEIKNGRLGEQHACRTVA